MATARKRTGTLERIVERRTRVLALRIGGGSYRAIAKEIGVSVKTAYNYVQASMDELKALKAKRAEQVLEIELSRLDRLTQAMWPKAIQGNTSAVGMLVRLAERRHKLLGLDAPTKLQHDLADGFTFTMKLSDEK